VGLACDCADSAPRRIAGLFWKELMTTALKTGYPGELHVYDDAEQLARAAAELFVKAMSKSIDEYSRFRVALSGGSTPPRVYELLAMPEFGNRIDWDHVDIFWGDERYVPPDDRDSNYRMTEDALLRHVPVPPANIHRVPTEISPPAAAAGAYEDDIRQCFRNFVSVPRFDLIYLGLGTNGHTASLFPHSPALKETSRLVLADFVAEVNTWRISMSAPLLNRGCTVAFLIEGAMKAQVLRDVLLGPRDPEGLPAQLIVPQGKLLWMVDRAAATLVSRADERRSA
jgi:6-phosphogluconolactonase